MPPESLPTTSPTHARVDARGVLAMLDAWESHPDIEMHSLMVLRHGQVLAQGWWAPYTPERPHLLYSLSKSFTSTALGLAVAEGRLGVDDLVVDHLPELREVAAANPGLRVRHLASMATGHLDDTWDDAVAADAADPVRGFLALAPEREPGSVFAYNQSATYTLATILQRLTGQTLTDYVRPRLLDPLGIGLVGWTQHPPGRDLGFSGLHAATDAVARLGQLYLQQGQWQGRVMLSPDWVAEATRVHVASPQREPPDWQQGYAYQFWRSRHGYRGDGAFGQFCLVLPEHDLVVATTAGTEQMQAVLDAVWEHLLPAVDRPSSPSYDEELAGRLATLALAPYDGPCTAAPTARHVLVPEDVGRPEQPSLARVEVEPDADGWRIVLVERDSDQGGGPGGGQAVEVRTEARVDAITGAPGGTAPGWTVLEGRVPVAASGGVAGDLLELELVFLETPHRLVLSGDLAAGTFGPRWRTAPLGGAPLSRLRCPR